MRTLRSILFWGAVFVCCCSGALAQTATTQIAVTPNASAYTAGECLGGVLTVPGMIRVNGPGGTILTQLDIVDPTGANAAVNVMLFDAAPTGTYTDHTNCTIASADRAKLIGVVPSSSFVCQLDGTSATGICQATPAVLITAPSFPISSSNIWAVPIMVGTPTYGGAQTLYFNFKAFPD